MSGLDGRMHKQEVTGQRTRIRELEARIEALEGAIQEALDILDPPDCEPKCPEALFPLAEALDGPKAKP